MFPEVYIGMIKNSGCQELKGSEIFTVFQKFTRGFKILPDVLFETQILQLFQILQQVLIEDRKFWQSPQIYPDYRFLKSIWYCFYVPPNSCTKIWVTLLRCPKFT